MDRRAWWATVHEVAKSQTRLSHFHFLGSPLSLFLAIVPLSSFCKFVPVAFDLLEFSHPSGSLVTSCFPVLLLLSRFSRVQLCVTP